MSSPCLFMNRVGSIEPFENPLDTRNLESSSYHALGACLSPYNAFFVDGRLCQDDIGLRIHLAGLRTLLPSEDRREMLF
ncbi:hypothetical protein Tco_0500505 [Tanacetum coccineum]